MVSPDSAVNGQCGCHDETGRRVADASQWQRSKEKQSSRCGTTVVKLGEDGRLFGRVAEMLPQSVCLASFRPQAAWLPLVLWYGLDRVGLLVDGCCGQQSQPSTSKAGRATQAQADWCCTWNKRNPCPACVLPRRQRTTGAQGAGDGIGMVHHSVYYRELMGISTPGQAKVRRPQGSWCDIT